MRVSLLLLLVSAMLQLVSPAALRAQGAAEVTKPGTLAEARAQFESADQELNRVYRQCTAPERTTVQSIAALKQAQQLWVQYRDENAAAYQTAQSSRQATKDQYYYFASTVITRSRIKELETLFLVP
jgi:uncharacterized protein YecT (DUF1311 family)